jgi:hypothetical protein
MLNMFFHYLTDEKLYLNYVKVSLLAGYYYNKEYDG